MEAYVSVVDQGGFSAAARAGGQSKAQVSRTISGLEEHLGIRLMQRSTRSHTLTEEGERYLQHAREMLDENARMEEELCQRQVVPRGRLKINAPLSWGERYLGSLMPGFMELFPEVELDITLTDRFVDLLDEGFDVAIRIGGEVRPSMVRRKLGTIRHGLFASPEYLKHNPGPETVQDFEKHKCLGYVRSGEVRPWFFRGERFVPKPVMVANNGDILRSAAVAGAGLTMLPVFFVEEDLATSNLVDLVGRCSSGHKDLDVPIIAVYPERRHLSPKVRVFIDYIAEALT